MGRYVIDQQIIEQGASTVTIALKKNGRFGMKQTKAPFHDNIILLGLASAFLISMSVSIFSTCYNFDIWYMMATGREILENGIPYDNPFSQHEGAQIIVQQWLLCVIYYLINEAFGMGGIAILITLVAMLIVVSAYMLGRLKKGDGFGGEVVALLCIPLLMALDVYLKMNSATFSMLIFIWIVYLLEKYRRTQRYLWLALLLPIGLVHAQLHLAFVLFDLVIIACYAIPDIPRLIDRARRGSAQYHITDNIAFADSSYKRLPVLIALIAFALVLFINPYGIRGVAYILLSYGAADYKMYIPEMEPLAVWQFGMNGIAMLILILFAYMAIAKRGLKSMDAPLMFMVLLTTVMTFQHLRNCWLAPLFGFMLICGATRGWSWEFANIKAFFEGRSAHAMRDARRSADESKSARALLVQRILMSVLCAVVAVVCAIYITVVLVPVMNIAEKTDEYTPQGIVDAIVDGSNGEDVKVYNPVELGGYLEWRGITPFIDSRVETWNSPISGLDQDRYYDYVDMVQNEWPIDRYQHFLDENDFDYLITESESTLESYLEGYGQDYIKLRGNSDYSLWKRNVE